MPPPAPTTLPSAPEADTTWRALCSAAAAPYRAAGRWAGWRAARTLARDPVYRHLLEEGRLWPAAQVVDIGCDRGLVASLLHACEQLPPAAWPAAWPPQPSASAYTGIGLRQADARAASAALGALPWRGPAPPRFIDSGVQQAELPPCDLALILDAMQHLHHAAQAELLRRVRHALALSGGPSRLLLRVDDQDGRPRLDAGTALRRLAAPVQGRRAAGPFGRPLAEWMALLLAMGYTVESQALNPAHPHAGVLLVADLGTGLSRRPFRPAASADTARA